MLGPLAGAYAMGVRRFHLTLATLGVASGCAGAFFGASCGGGSLTARERQQLRIDPHRSANLNITAVPRLRIADIYNGRWRFRFESANEIRWLDEE